MAFENTAQSQTPSRFPNNGQAGQNDQWKADAFLNIYVPTSGGKRRKLGFIALKKSRPAEHALIERLEKNPNDVEALKAVMELEFHMAEGEESAQFAF